jgi:hypothetical protein
MKIKAWMLATLLVALSSLPVVAGVFYSPVYNMPLQPAPSPSNGGFYWVLPDGRVFGPNYNLYPPFTPISGFDNTSIGQGIFAKLYEDALTGKGGSGKGGPGGGPGAAPGGPGGGPGGPGGGSGGPGGSGGGPGGPGGPGGNGPPPKQKGFGGYNLDYSDPETWKNFNVNPLPNGFNPFGPMQAPTYGNGPMPMPRYANYPNFQAPAPMPNYGGYRTSMNMPLPQAGVYQAGYLSPNFDGGYWQGPIQQVQAQATPPYYAPPSGYPQGQPMGPNMGYGYSPSLPGTPCPPQIPSLPYYRTPQYSMPYYPVPNYSMPQTCFPTLPNVGYEGPPCPPCGGIPRQFYTNPMVRSPRDFWMWTEVQEDKADRARNPLKVP